MLENETVWLSQKLMAELFETTIPNINFHIKNIYKEGELNENPTIKDYLIVQKEGEREVERLQKFYNLDVIISVGYRVKSQRGTQFRIWANSVLKEYLLKGYAIRPEIDVAKLYANHENRITALEESVDFFVKTSLPPKEGVFFDGQIFDAYIFVSNLIKSADKSIILIDNWVDETVLVMLSGRKSKVSAKIYTQRHRITEKLQLALEKHSQQYEAVTIDAVENVHDRFLIIDNTVYVIGASMKDLGKRLFAFFKMEIRPDELMKNICRQEIEAL